MLKKINYEDKAFLNIVERYYDKEVLYLYISVKISLNLFYFLKNKEF